MTADRIRLDGRVAVVTGGANGIGEGAALSLAGLGADIVIGDIDVANAERVADLARGLGRQARVVEANAMAPEAQGRLVATATDEFGRLDILVNNAGGVKKRYLHSQNGGNWQRVVDLNLISMVAATQAAAEAMRAGGRGGAIINVSSTEGLRGAPGYSVYAACKAAMVSFTKTMALELGTAGIRVNCIAPDLVATPGLGTLGEAAGDDKPERLRYTPFGRMAGIEEAGDVIAFLASDMASWVTGTTIPVDGGCTAASGWHLSADDPADWTLYAA